VAGVPRAVLYPEARLLPVLFARPSPDRRCARLADRGPSCLHPHRPRRHCVDVRWDACSMVYTIPRERQEMAVTCCDGRI